MGNQAIISGTADYDFKHFASYWNRYKAIIESKGDNQKLIESLQNQLKEMRSDDETLYDMIEDIHKFLNISTE